MIPIQVLLNRFKGITNTDKGKKQVVVNELKNRGINIELKNIIFLKNTIIIRTTPIIKTEILFIKKEIISSLSKRKETKSFTDVK